jgi:hypothetical protein
MFGIDIQNTCLGDAMHKACPYMHVYVHMHACMHAWLVYPLYMRW